MIGKIKFLLMFSFLLTSLLGCSLFSNRKPAPLNESISLSQAAEDLSVYVYWDESHQSARLEDESNFAIFEPGSYTASLNGAPAQMNFSAYHHEGEIFIPVAFYQQQLKPLFQTWEPVVAPKKIAQEKVTRIQVAEKIEREFVVVIDPGHGGKDPGAVGINNVYEKNLNLDISKRVVKYLEASGIGVVMTRSDDTFISLNKRAEMATGANCFVSIHFNSVGSSSPSGFEVWRYSGDGNRRSKRSLDLAQKIRHKIKNGTPLRDRKVKDKGLKVLKSTTVPAVLVECGFVSNAKDMQWFSSENNREKISHLIYQGIVEFLEQ